MINYRKKAFTLAEVLITLGIIGVIAAMTLPVLIHNHKKKEVETKLKGFYSLINQGLKMSELVNGDIENWEEIPFSDEDGILEWAHKYISKYIKVTGSSKCISGNNHTYQCGCLYFANGSGVAIHNHVWFFYPLAKDIKNEKSICGKDFFAFGFAERNSKGKYLEPFLPSGYNDSQLKANDGFGCSKTNSHWCSGWFCTKLIINNNWEVPNDYPYRF